MCTSVYRFAVSHVSSFIAGYIDRCSFVCTYIVGVRILCSKISELCYALMLTIYANYAPQISHYAPEICHYASKLNHFFKSQTAGNDRPPSFSMLSGSALVLLELSEASSPESSTSSPSLETVVNLVPDATLSDRLL